MRCLLLHCRSFAYRLMTPTPAARADEQGRADSLADCLAVFVAVETGDGEREIGRCAKEIRKWARKSGASAIAVNPFAHLTENGASAAAALAGCEALQRRLAETADVQVAFTSFGWIKQFDVDVLGHVWAQGWVEARA